MVKTSLKRAQSNWVDGDRFWDREHELKTFTEYLDEGAHILLIAPRRIGKTSLIREAARRLSGRFICLYVDLQNCHSAADAIVEFSLATRQYSSLWKKTKAIFSNALEQIAGRIDSVKIDDITIALRGGLNTGNWQVKGDRLFESLAANEQPVVVFFDEVPILVNRILKGGDYQITPEQRRETDSFMSWLRLNSIRYKGKIRLVIAGSIGLEPVLQQAGLNATLNSFTPFELSPWTSAIAIGCINALANEYGLHIPQQVADHMIKKLGVCIPHHVEMFFEHVYQECRRHGLQEVSINLVNDVYNTQMLSLRGHVELSHMEERLRMVLGPELSPLALELLTETAIVGSLKPQAIEIISKEYSFENKTQTNVLHEIISILEHDGYLLKKGTNHYTFQSKLLRDWWKNRFGLFYRVASKRKA